jgi:hypothetical protein
MRHPHRRRPRRSLVDHQRPAARADDRHRGLRHQHRLCRPQRHRGHRARRPLVEDRAGAAAAHRRLPRLAPADAERALPPVPRGRRRDRRQPRAQARAGQGHRRRDRLEPAAEHPPGRDRVPQRARRCDRQHHARHRPRHLPRRRLRRGGRRVPPARQSGCGAIERRRAGRQCDRRRVAAERILRLCRRPRARRRPLRPARRAAPGADAASTRSPPRSAARRHRASPPPPPCATSGQYEDDQNSRIDRAATTLDLTASLPIGRGISVQARAENVTNTRIDATIAADGTVERASPRTLWIGVRFKG